ncbi:MAG: NHLP family bacteriocin export ABC transporter peptidase/permease/ATPase subunit [Alphaproteobacteria bacterium]|nr:NHLP family bacteriocin export ABC transporter peptidase/permease/ATPase subunit [Alphaproteobacteria bacterium]
MEAVECGAASLAMVLAHYGRWVPLEELRQACGVSRDGVKATNLLKAARAYGLLAKGFKKEPHDLERMPWPLIIHWNFNHFLVLEGIRGNDVFLNDPALGPRRVTREELNEAFTGVALAFEPSSDFVRTRRPPGMVKLLGARLKKSGVALQFVMLATVALVVPGVVLPVFSQIFVDDVLVGGRDDWLLPLLLGMLATALVRTALTWLQQDALIRLEAKLSAVSAYQFIDHMLRLPMAFFGQRHAGELMNRMLANERIARLLSGELATNLLNASTVLFFAAVMLCYDTALTATVIGLALINILVVQIGARRQEMQSRRELAEQGKLAAATIGTIHAIETVKASGLEARAFEKWAGYHALLLGVRQELGLQAAMLAVAPALLAGLSAAAVVGLGAWQVMQGAMTLGTLVAFQSLAESFTQPLTKLVQLKTQLQSARADLQRVDDLMVYPAAPAWPSHRDSESGEPADRLLRLSGAVELRNVSFGYNPLDQPLISGLSLSMQPGMRVALVGGSGSGKSTVGRLIAGLLPPWSGEIVLDGYPLGEISPALRARSLAYVDQDIFLFEGTVRDNLTLWDDGLPDVQLNAALADAALFDEIAERKGQLDAAVGEGGNNFSGGQRQRLEIARALVGEPAILILDEATAALDPAMEKRIDDQLRRRGCTCIIIAHRLSTIRDCDEIIVLRGGRIVGRGTHETLLAQGGEYAALVAAR